jgi:hypothetical protein
MSILKGSDNDVWHLGLMKFWTLPIVQYFTEHNILETGPASILKWRVWYAPILSSLTEGANLNPVKEDGPSSGFQNVMFFRIPDDGQSKKTQ